MTDPIADIIGDYRGFTAQQRNRLLVRGMVKSLDLQIGPVLSDLGPR